jgi:hypothetical protein
MHWSLMPMTALHRDAIRLQFWLPIAALALMPLAGCGFSPPESAAQREASESCGHEADRVYDAQNRYQLSERTENDSPFSGSTPRPLPSDGLSDKYHYDEMVSDCLKRSEAVPAAGDPAK